MPDIRPLPARWSTNDSVPPALKPRGTDVLGGVGHNVVVRKLVIGAVSTLLAVVVSFGGRYLTNAAAYWLLDARGVITFWLFGSSLLAGLLFPLHFLPQWLTVTIWVLTPFPSMLQAPLDVIVERGSATRLVVIVAGQAVWAAVLLGLCWWVQARATAKLVIQGG